MNKINSRKRCAQLAVAYVFITCHIDIESEPLCIIIRCAATCVTSYRLF